MDGKTTTVVQRRFRHNELCRTIYSLLLADKKMKTLFLQVEDMNTTTNELKDAFDLNQKIVNGLCSHSYHDIPTFASDISQCITKLYNCYSAPTVITTDDVDLIKSFAFRKCGYNIDGTCINKSSIVRKESEEAYIQHLISQYPSMQNIHEKNNGGFTTTFSIANANLSLGTFNTLEEANAALNSYVSTINSSNEGIHETLSRALAIVSKKERDNKKVLTQALVLASSSSSSNISIPTFSSHSSSPLRVPNFTNNTPVKKLRLNATPAGKVSSRRKTKTGGRRRKTKKVTNNSPHKVPQRELLMCSCVEGQELGVRIVRSGTEIIQPAAGIAEDGRIRYIATNEIVSCAQFCRLQNNIQRHPYVDIVVLSLGQNLKVHAEQYCTERMTPKEKEETETKQDEEEAVKQPKKRRKTTSTSTTSNDRSTGNRLSGLDSGDSVCLEDSQNVWWKAVIVKTSAATRKKEFRVCVQCHEDAKTEWIPLSSSRLLPLDGPNNVERVSGVCTTCGLVGSTKTLVKCCEKDCPVITHTYCANLPTVPRRWLCPVHVRKTRSRK